MEALNVQREELAQLQADYLQANVKSSRLLQEYETMNKAFLDEQAGIIASSLVEGIPCPVCGDTSHPQLATLSTDAPTEAEVKKAKNISCPGSVAKYGNLPIETVGATIRRPRAANVRPCVLWT